MEEGSKRRKVGGGRSRRKAERGADKVDSANSRRRSRCTSKSR